MPSTPFPFDPNAIGRPAHVGPGLSTGTGHGDGGPSPKRVVVAYGFWVFLLSDIVMFSAFFATYAVLSNATDGGPTARELFDLRNVALETACLLSSSVLCGMAWIAASSRNRLWTQVALLGTGLLGLAFIALEAREFATMATSDAGPTRSAFLSAFFALVGLHGLHVSVGLLWLGAMMAQIAAKGFRPNILRRLFCFVLFWHALDIVWVALFTVVYLMGAA
jgi:cytochrome o ubiquinol oxidase subunit 3